LNIRLVLAALLVVGFTALGISDITKKNDKIQLKNIELKSTSTKLKTLELKYDHLQVELNKTDATNEAKIKQLESEKQHLEQERQRLEKEVAVKAEAKRVAALKLQNAATAATGTATAYAASNGYCGDNQYKQFIYQHESGCNTNRWNSSGCYGIGQSCPASKIAHCGADFACQDAWFSNYAVSRYGSWAGAYAFWAQNHWW
jgi:hypothetical protein